MLTQRSRGFTLIEVMVTVAIIAILGAVALPSYNAYVQRSRVPPAFDGLSSYAVRMEQRYQDTGCYAGTCSPVNSVCGAALPTGIDNFAISCTLSNNAQGYTATATGSGSMSGYTYTINNTGARATTAHPKGTNGTCWTSRGTTCDS